MFLLEIAVLLLAAFGHTIIWIGALNRIHSTGLPRWVVEALSLPCRLAFVGLPFLATSQFVRLGQLAFSGWPVLLSGYVSLTACIALAGTAIEAYRAFGKLRSPRILISHRTGRARIDEILSFRPVAAPIASVLSRVPGNQIFDVRVEEKELAVPNLDSRLSGLRVAHLTDFHMSGRIDRPFFEKIVDLTNQAKPDLILLTGDLFDEPECIDWIPATLGRLRAPGGVYFILGNHDRRVDETLARGRLVEAGLIDLGGHTRAVSLFNSTILLAGNELPWFSPAADVDSFSESCNNGAFRILLSHTPDQIDWARAKGFDLMLAGHTHGGQFKLPVFGAILAPSRMGTRFASGVFWEDPTVLHVSRGISSLLPIRINCPPELAILTLRPLVARNDDEICDREELPAALATATS